MRDYLLVTKAVSDESRVRILKLLENGELCVCQIMAVIGLGQSTISKHLAILKTAGLVDDRKDGLWVYYHLCRDEVSEYNQVLLKHIGDWLNEDKKITSDRKKWAEAKQIDIKVLCKNKGVVR